MPRDPRLDCGKGLLIVLVVLGHVVEVAAPPGEPGLRAGWSSAPQAWLLTGVYVFHMPLFVLFAGVTAKAAGRALRAVQMLVILVPVQLLFVVPRILSGQVGAEALIVPVFALWFLPALAVWLLLTPVIDRLPRSSLVVAVLLAVIAAAVPGGTGVLAWSRTLFFLPFFVVGHVWGWHLLRITRPTPVRSAVAAAVLIGCGPLAASIPGDPVWIMGTGTAEGLALPVPTAVLTRTAALLLMAVAAGAALLLVPTASRVLEVLGRRTLGIFVVHQLVVQPLEAVAFPASIPWPVLLVGALVGAVALLVLCSRPVIDRTVRRWSDAAARLLLRPLPSSAR